MRFKSYHHEYRHGRAVRTDHEVERGDRRAERRSPRCWPTRFASPRGRGRGRCTSSVPSDVSRATVVGSARCRHSEPGRGAVYRPIQTCSTAQRSLLQSARRPVLLLGVAAGQACQRPRRSGGCLPKAPLPVACTFEGNGVVPRELLDCFIGRVGYAHNQPADRLLQQADVVVCVGYDLIEYDPTEWLGPATTVIHLDEVPATIDRAYRPAVELVGDLGRTDRRSGGAPGPACGGRGRADPRGATAAPRGAGTRGEPGGHTGPPAPRAARPGRRSIGDDVTVTCDVGAHQIWTARYFYRFAPRRLFFSMGHQTMGVGLPWAIGAALARPGESVVSISGDGSFLMTCMELETAVRLKLPTVHLVWRDGSYNLVGLLALRDYGREVGTHFGPTDFVTLARFVRGRGVPVTDADEFRPTLERALALKSPAVIEIPVDYRENLAAGAADAVAGSRLIVICSVHIGESNRAKRNRIYPRTRRLACSPAALSAAPDPPDAAALHEVFQNSTINALLEGVYDGSMTYGELRRHGDFGLGTFNGLDGEMIAFDGRLLPDQVGRGRLPGGRRPADAVRHGAVFRGPRSRAH